MRLRFWTFSVAALLLAAQLLSGLISTAQAVCCGDSQALAGVPAARSGPSIVVLDEMNLQQTAIVAAGQSFILRGEGFQPGPVEITLDGPDGELLGTAAAGPTGSFEARLFLPSTAPLQFNTLFARQIVDDRTVLALDEVFIAGTSR